jgi:hypothetical protein
LRWVQTTSVDTGPQGVNSSIDTAISPQTLVRRPGMGASSKRAKSRDPFVLIIRLAVPALGGHWARYLGTVTKSNAGLKGLEIRLLPQETSLRSHFHTAIERKKLMNLGLCLVTGAPIPSQMPRNDGCTPANHNRTDPNEGARGSAIVDMM